ncbi:MAG: DUF1289 domain-containing protein [Gammaproteobacteria bacterium]|nr:DUF1289 domain-containing protein [Gammaproteobacteria bacterium]
MNNVPVTPEADSLVPSPCIRNCCLDEDDVCLGCFRNLAEVIAWSEADNATREIVLKNAAARRQTYLDRCKQL